MTILAKIQLVDTTGNPHFPLLTKKYDSKLVPIKGMEFKDSICFKDSREIKNVILNMDNDIYDVYLVDDNISLLSIKNLKDWYIQNGWTEEPNSFA